MHPDYARGYYSLSRPPTATSATTVSPDGPATTRDGAGVVTPAPFTRTLTSLPVSAASLARLTRTTCNGRRALPVNSSVEVTPVIRIPSSSHPHRPPNRPDHHPVPPPGPGLPATRPHPADPAPGDLAPALGLGEPAFERNVSMRLWKEVFRE